MKTILGLTGVLALGSGVQILTSSNQVESFGFLDVTGKAWTIQQAGGSRATVIAITGTTCPLSKKYGPTLAAIEARYRSRGVRFIFVNPSGAESAADGLADAKRLGFKGPYTRDASVASQVNARSTTEVIVLDAKRHIRYRGAVDDQYGLNYAIEKPRKAYLIDALDALVAGKSPKIAETEAPGCVLGEHADVSPAVTYHARIASLLQKHCVDCHRDGGVAPFSLEKYADVKARAPMLKFAIDKGIMPPWFASKETPGPWRNDRSLTDEDKKAFADWVDGGMPEGDPALAPAPKKYASSWSIGKPDAVLQIPAPFEVKATGTMPYRVAMIETSFDEDKWIEAMEIQPTDRSVVHHVLIFLRPKGKPVGNDLGEEIAGFFAGYVPGNDHMIYPEGFGKLLPKGASLKVQIHYTPNGKATKDQTRFAVRFAQKPIKHEVQTIGIANLLIRIPPGADNHKESAQLPVPYDVRLLSFIPHMHVRGKAARYELVTPTGRREVLLDVPRYDFNWQITYEYAQPKLIPKGSRVEFSAWYDNSDKNPANPDPTRTVPWGDQTYDEMHLGYVEYYVPGAKPGEPIRPMRRTSDVLVETIFGQMDRNKDGFVTQAEAGLAWTRLKEADADGDGKISLAEALAKFGT